MLRGLARNTAQRLFRGVADLPVGILDEQREDGDLFVGARHQRALRRLEAHLALDLAALEVIEERSRADHRTR